MVSVYAFKYAPYIALGTTLLYLLWPLSRGPIARDLRIGYTSGATSEQPDYSLR